MDYKTLYSADVVVAGGGLAGCAAAIAAAREGLSVCLIEASGVVGGAATNGLVAPISSLNGNISNVKFGGIGQEFVDLNIEKAKEFCKATEAPANSLHTTKYIPNFDKFGINEKREVLRQIYGIKMDSWNDEEIEFKFRMVMANEIRNIERDIENFS